LNSEPKFEVLVLDFGDLKLKGDLSFSIWSSNMTKAGRKKLTEKFFKVKTYMYRKLI